MENLRHRIDVKLANNEKSYLKSTSVFQKTKFH